FSWWRGKRPAFLWDGLACRSARQTVCKTVLQKWRVWILAPGAFRLRTTNIPLFWGEPIMAPAALLAIDQGTTSTPAVVYDSAGRALGTAARELTQHYPRPGCVEHDAEEIWQSVAAVVPAALTAAGIAARDLAAVGLTNQRETVVLWKRTGGRPVAR